MIASAAVTALKRGIENVQFELRDASDLSIYKDHEFDIAVTSMAVHQFDADLAVRILTEMKRIASKVIIVDYNFPIPGGFYRSLVYSIERIAGGDHWRNFRVYMRREGIHHFTEAAGITVKSEVVRGNGVFLIMVCD